MAETPSRAALLTGCSTGIGRATPSTSPSAAGRSTRPPGRVESVADLEQAGCRTLALDVTDEASMRAAVEQVEREQGAVGVLVNNAGYSQSGTVEEVDLDAVRRQFETNVFGAARMCQLVLPGMRRQRSGRIVNISSMGANFVFPGGGYYHATKSALDAISDALRFEVKGFGIDVVIIQPGLIRTEFSTAATDAMSSATGDGDGGPYAAFNAALAKATHDTYERGPLAKLGGPPEAVAQVIEKALTARRPKARYLVTPSAHMLVNQRRVMTDRAWDAMLRTQFPQPGKS
jgi:NAD(P)-dependent dehydrogenase (short-subunit alcohol dehydrogenase family)